MGANDERNDLVYRSLEVSDGAGEDITTIVVGAGKLLVSALVGGATGDVVENLADTAFDLFSGGSQKKKLHWLAQSVAAHVNRLDFRVDELKKVVERLRQRQEWVFQLLQAAVPVPVSDAEKLEMLRSALVNTVVGDMEDEWMPALLEGVGALSTLEVRLLRVFYFHPSTREQPPMIPHGVDIPPVPADPLRLAVDALGIPSRLQRVMVDRLERIGLVHLLEVRLDDGMGEVRDVHRTELGSRFLKLVNEGDADSSTETP